MASPTTSGRANRVPSLVRTEREECGFTLVELMVVVAVIGVLAALLLPTLSKARERASAATCYNNTHQLILAWQMYADDNRGRLAYNLGGTGGRAVAPRSELNWVNNILSWELDSDNTNIQSLAEGTLWRYTSECPTIYRCPSDTVVSPVQRAAGWSARVRSYSMNAMVGNAGPASQKGYNENNPDFSQFFNIASIPRPSEIFVFVEEHPDSINDGYFINRTTREEWVDLPASYHNGAATFSFADGHATLHTWEYESTQPPAAPDVVSLPAAVPYRERGDFYWVLDRMSVRRRPSTYYDQ